MSSSRPKVVCLGGSMRVNSYTMGILNAMAILGSHTDVTMEVLSLRELDLPMYHPEYGIEDYPAESFASITRLTDGYRSADAMVWACPTYHGTVSGVFKNAIDFAELLSRDPKPYLQGKAVGLISVNDTRTFASMRDSVHELRAWVAPTQIRVTRDDFEEGTLNPNAQTLNRLQRQLEELISFIK